MWLFLAISHSPTTANEILANKPYFCLGLLAYLADTLIPVDVRLIILGVFYPFSPSQGGIPLGTLNDCWVKQTFGKSDVFRTPSETGCLITSDTDSPLLTCYTGCDGVIIFILFSGEIISTWVRVLLWSSSRSRVNQVSLRTILSGAPLREMRCTICFQFGGIVSSLMNVTVENSSSNTTWNWGEKWSVAGFRIRATNTAWYG